MATLPRRTALLSVQAEEGGSVGATVSAWSISEATESDFPRWRELYQGYADFYNDRLTE